LTRQCKITHLWIFWDCKGDYLGFELHKDEPLTKTDHVLFLSNDYKKLDRILSDTMSILKNLKPKDLTLLKDNKNGSNVDGSTGATQPELSFYVVKDAVFTCYTLWHTVYGSTREKIIQILNQKPDSEYLALLFSQKDIKYRILAMNLIEQNTEYKIKFFPDVIQLINSNDSELARRSFEFLKRNRNYLSELSLQKLLVYKLNETAPNLRYEILGILNKLPYTDAEVSLTLLQYFEDNKLNTRDLYLVYKMMNPVNLKNKEILNSINKNLNSDNFYVQTISRNILKTSITNNLNQ
jgi:hypothetical protein